jgi:hypothetical protein
MIDLLLVEVASEIFTQFSSGGFSSLTRAPANQKARQRSMLMRQR